MSFTYATVKNNVLYRLGYYDGTTTNTTTIQDTRIYFMIDEAVKYFRDSHRCYYASDIAYVKADEDDHASKTIAIDATDDYKLTVTLDGMAWQRLVGAVIVKTESSVEKRNVVREVVDTDTGEVKLLYPNEFSNGDATIRVRMVVPSDRFTLEYPYMTTGKVAAGDNTRYTMRYVEENYFFESPGILQPSRSYPSVYTFTTNGVIIVDNLWPLEPTYKLHFKGYRAPSLYSASSDNVDVPDPYQTDIEQFVWGMYERNYGNTNKGMMLLEGAKKAIRNRKRFAGGS